jgi:imidazolonepropionase-like amidohydrolase
MKTMGHGVIICSLLLIASGASSLRPAGREQAKMLSREKTLLTNVRIWDVQSGEMSPPREILIDGSAIVAVGESLTGIEGARRLDGGGGYVVPGLFDCHAHLAESEALGDAHLRNKLKAFVEHGVTQVRDVGGPIGAVRRMKSRIDSGEMAGPEMFFAGPLLETPPLAHEEAKKDLPGFTVPIASVEDVERILPELAAQGACMVKTFNKIDRELFLHTIETAGRLSLRVVHDPGEVLFHSVPMDDALDMGVTSIEHAKSPWPVVLKDDLRREHDKLLGANAVASARMGFQARISKLGTESVSRERLTALAAKMKAKGAFLCPTITVLNNLERIAIEQVKAQMKLDVLPPPVLAAIRSQTGGVGEVSRMFVKEFAREGVPLLVGQDGDDPAATLAEMRAMQACGVSPLEILKGATLYPARWLGVEGRLGSIAPGKEANIVVVKEDPSGDIGHLDAIVLVLQRGRIVRG